MLIFIRYLFGYLTIKLCGQNAEQILNNATKNGIEIWNLKFKNKNIYGNISIKNFYHLRKLKKGIKCKISIEKKHGIIFKLKKHQNRYGLIVGFIAFAAILYLLTNYIWIIDVEGNKKLAYNEIINSCKKIGIYQGIKKNKIESKYDSQRLQLTQDGIAWCSMNVEGCVLTVNLSETAVSDKEQRQIPSNLKASIEGKIKKINITSGNTLVKVGDTVAKGELLVSGVVENMSSSLFIHSEGEIVAETKRVFSAKSDFTKEITYETDEIISRYTIDFFGVKIPTYLGNIKKPHSYDIETSNLTLFKKRIPIAIIKENYAYTKKEKISYDKNTLVEKLYKEIKNQIDAFSFIKITERKKDIIETENGILLKIECICEENIAVQDAILFNTEN
ncbi:MAG: sporulation protein YqfD [Clostridia bacterium]|nr:sporulation protein YqfD [Clostridia bacterium]